VLKKLFKVVCEMHLGPQIQAVEENEMGIVCRMCSRCEKSLQNIG